MTKLRDDLAEHNLRVAAENQEWIKNYGEPYRANQNSDFNWEVTYYDKLFVTVLSKRDASILVEKLNETDVDNIQWVLEKVKNKLKDLARSLDE